MENTLFLTFGNFYQNKLAKFYIANEVPIWGNPLPSYRNAATDCGTFSEVTAV